MLLVASALVVLAAACGVLVRTGSPGPELAPDAGSSDPWRDAALAERADVRDLQHAIALALDTRDQEHQERLLRAALVRSRGHAPVRVSL